MITDKINNINLYNQIPEIVRNYIPNLFSSIKQERIILSDNIYINIESYETKLLRDIKFEAHKNYIDIQILIEGNEDIYYTNKLNLNISEPYNESNDCVFYSNRPENYSKVTLDGTNFVLLFPHEAHAPQASINDKTSLVKKAVIKIHI